MNLPSVWNCFQRGSYSSAQRRSNSSACSARTWMTMVFSWLILSALPTEVQEVGVDAEPVRPALLGMELGTHHVQLRGRGGRSRVGAAAGVRGTGRGVGMHEVEVGAVRDPGPERRPVGLPEAAPADDRQVGGGSHQVDLSPQQAQALVPPVLARFLEEQLVTQANTEQRLALPSQLHDLAAEVARGQLLEGGGESADARQHDAVRTLQVLLVRADLRFGPHPEQGALDRAQVADAVVDDRDQPSRPFEEGIPRPPRDIASRSASPSALAADSAMWWRLRPRIRSTWMVAPRWIENARQNSSSTSDSRLPTRPRSGRL